MDAAATMKKSPANVQVREKARKTRANVVKRIGSVVSVKNEVVA